MMSYMLLEVGIRCLIATTTLFTLAEHTPQGNIALKVLSGMFLIWIFRPFYELYIKIKKQWGN